MLKWALPLTVLLLASCAVDRSGLELVDGGRADAGDAGLVCPPGYVNANGDPSDGCECQFIADLDVCNGVDDDCDPSTADGSEDPDLGVECDGRDPDFCARGRTQCGAGGEVACLDDLASPELCDIPGVDDNCDGAVDEGCACTGTESRPCGLSVGACMEGRQECSGGVWSECTGGINPIDELCNGLDDNCDGVVDEPWPGLGAACTAGTGACRQTGERICNAAMTGTMCSVSGGAPTTELCNAIDDDCDMAVDEAFPTLGDACSDGAGVCAMTGTIICGLDGASRCSASAGTGGAEICDAADNDCDGSTDEGFGLGSACSAGVGVCMASGTIVCDGGGGTRCTAMAGTPGTESCNGADDDCDSSTDEGTTASCMVFSCSGTMPCGGGTCTVPMDPESCNGSDDDCDGSTDEGTTEPCSVGTCTGTMPCGGGTCSVSSMPETCNAVDDDCDGNIDEGTGTCGTDCEVVVRAADGHSYILCPNRVTIADAIQHCDDRPPYRMVELETAGEHNFLVDPTLALDQRDWWLGLNRDASGDWSWEDGSPAPPTGGGFNGWEADAPDSSNPRDCGRFDPSTSPRGAVWIQRDCGTATSRIICEAAP